MIPANLDRDQMAVELAKRSYKNLQEYQGDYEVTHLLNSLVSLLIIPKETFYTSKSKGIEDNAISERLLIQLRQSIEDNAKNKDEILPIKLNEIIRHMRNAICHGNIMFRGEKPPRDSDPVIVRAIEFGDAEGAFKIKISKENIELLVKEFSAWILEKYS